MNDLATVRSGRAGERIAPEPSPDAMRAVGRELIAVLDEENTASLPRVLSDFHNEQYLKLRELKEVTAEGTRSLSDDPKRVGQTFWNCYRTALRRSLCSKDGELYKLFAREGKVSTKAVIAGLASTLGLGSAFAGLLCGLAVVLLEVGIDAFCEWSGQSDRNQKR